MPSWIQAFPQPLLNKVGKQNTKMEMIKHSWLQPFSQPLLKNLTMLLSYQEIWNSNQISKPNE